ncbi:MAG: hypothetical protein E7662_06355 [Ruminococcaceae bacterium]|nr:hypothetical protein [Oscillospiraceae bacterium]
MKTFFEPTLEAQLKSLGERRRLRTAIITALWSAAVIGVWIGFLLYSKRSVIDFTTVFVLILLALPFLLFGAHKTLFGKSYYATVTDARYAQRMKNMGTGGTRKEFREAEIEVAVITLKTDTGETVRMEFPEDSVRDKEIYYKSGDRVMKINGLKFPVKCPLDCVERILCPRCGHFMKTGLRSCGWCKTSLEN